MTTLFRSRNRFLFPRPRPLRGKTQTPSPRATHRARSRYSMPDKFGISARVMKFPGLSPTLTRADRAAAGSLMIVDISQTSRTPKYANVTATPNVIAILRARRRARGSRRAEVRVRGTDRKRKRVYPPPFYHLAEERLSYKYKGWGFIYVCIYEPPSNWYTSPLLRKKRVSRTNLLDLGMK